MSPVIALNGEEGKILSAVMLAVPWQAQAAPWMMHAASPGSVTSRSGLQEVLHLIAAAGFFLSLPLCTMQVTLLHDYKTLFSVNGSLSFCLQ